MMPLSLKSQDLKRRANDILKDAMTRREKLYRCMIISILKGYYRDVILLAKQAIKAKKSNGG